MKRLRKAVIGVGNILMGDDGVGVYVARRLMSQNFNCTDVYDGGTMGLELIFIAYRYDKVVFIDAVRLGGGPGSIYRFEFKGCVEESIKRGVSMHSISLIDALDLALKTGFLKTNIVFIGIEPGYIGFRIGLSKKVEEAIPMVLDAVCREVC